MKETKLSRRAFLGLGATAAVAAGAAGLAGCAPQQGAGTASAEGNGGSGSAAASSVSPTKYTPDFLTPPEVPTDIKEEKDCDVLVIGMGLAGTAAAKEAAERLGGRRLPLVGRIVVAAQSLGGALVVGGCVTAAALALYVVSERAAVRGYATRDL